MRRSLSLFIPQFQGWILAPGGPLCPLSWFSKPVHPVVGWDQRVAQDTSGRAAQASSGALPKGSHNSLWQSTSLPEKTLSSSRKMSIIRLAGKTVLRFPG